MGINRMSGTSWHVEVLKKNIEEKRRNKYACKYFKNGYCSKLENTCYGSAKCDFYIESENYIKQEIKINHKYKSDNYNKNDNMVGKFTIEYTDGVRKQFILGENIRRNHPLVNVVLNTKINKYLEYNTEKMKLISKKIRFNREVYDIYKNTFINKLLTKEKIKNVSNNTNIQSLKCKIKFLINDYKFMFVAGRNISWSDPLIKTLEVSPLNKMIRINDIEFVIISKYIEYKGE